MSDKAKKLSDLMRIGAKAGNQLYFNLMDENKNSCAVGAIIIGAYPDVRSGYGEAHFKWAELVDRFNTAKRIMNPVTGLHDSVTCVIIDLNNKNKWTREKIADWLESIGY